jgi:hypothetical protein
LEVRIFSRPVCGIPFTAELDPMADHLG